MPEVSGFHNETRMTRIISFPPVSDDRARLLILGSMPGRASLLAQQYYAHPRNAFWTIMGHLLGFPPATGYEQRLQILVSRGIALWDVLQSCSREGSLDAGIDDTSVIVNDIGQLLRRHPGITRIYFNGTKARDSFRRHVQPRLGGRNDDLICRRLPSTSPAHASVSFSGKLDAWRILLTDERFETAAGGSASKRSGAA